MNYHELAEVIKLLREEVWVRTLTEHRRSTASKPWRVRKKVARFKRETRGRQWAAEPGHRRNTINLGEEGIEYHPRLLEQHDKFCRAMKRRRPRGRRWVSIGGRGNQAQPHDRAAGHVNYQVIVGVVNEPQSSRRRTPCHSAG